jgi:hypothetical protein
MQEQLLVSSFGSHDSVCKPDLPTGKFCCRQCCQVAVENVAVLKT